ncbi:MAG: FeoA domain-containing protein [Eubacteriales bacterium]
MPLSMAKIGEINSIKKISGKSNTKRFLETLGFVVGEEVFVVTELCGNIIVNIKNSRIAISREMANRIIV